MSTETSTGTDTGSGTTPAVATAAAATVPVTRSAAARSGSVAKLWGPPLVVFAVIVAAWIALAAILDASPPHVLLPSPLRIVVDSFSTETLDGQPNQPITGELLNAIALTMQVALSGLAISIVVGIVWAILMSQARWVERSLFPYAVILQCVPILALVPLIGNTIDYGIEARILVCVLISLFPMVSNTLFGLQSVERSQRELFKLQKASRWTVLTKLQLPNALPAIFAGMRISAGLAIVGAIVGDFFFRRGQPGLGILISNYQSRLQTPELFAAVIVAALLGVLIFLIFGWISKLAVGRWYEPAS
ncbi:ABC transporter permease [Marisediminicola senii]|uniref:ABC transporter permease n=1 Tax=Marisediminicola senii TaxID=2711233 RepID=UPI0013EAFCB1|nr:ABC transporter permease [Marisediminicola senii]